LPNARECPRVAFAIARRVRRERAARIRIDDRRRDDDVAFGKRGHADDAQGQAVRAKFVRMFAELQAARIAKWKNARRAVSRRVAPRRGSRRDPLGTRFETSGIGERFPRLAK